MSTEQKHWAKEVVRRTKRRDNIINTRFVQKKINRLTTVIAEACATISETQIQLSTYWMQTISETTNQRLAQTTANIIAKKLSVDRTCQTIAVGSVETNTNDELGTGTTAAAPTTTVKNYVREPVERIEKYILEYIYFCTQHVKKMAQTRIQLAKAQMEEYKVLEDFEQITTPAQLFDGIDSSLTSISTSDKLSFSSINTTNPLLRRCRRLNEDVVLRCR
ncbi:unnamed protein product [Rotaria sordida]|uniref:Uncharacterized protein n=1 Tax=Rotaria sordida TaxID=392033 RepID=A0A815NWE6_9BILA|nr:unnamed protein product [Rotaria sordida]